MHWQTEENAYHIDGDEDDANSSGNADKLMTAITNDPDTVINFMQDWQITYISQFIPKCRPHP